MVYPRGLAGSYKPGNVAEAGCVNRAHVAGVISKYEGRLGGLIGILQEIQSRYGYLPAEALRTVAATTGRTLTEVYGVATFYRSFSLKPRGKHVCSVCLGTACHVRGGPVVLEEFARQLGARPGETTADGEFTLETVNCLGACALGPIVVSDGRYFANVSPIQARDIVQETREGLDPIDVTTDRRIFPVDVSCARCNASLMDPARPVDGYPSIRITVSFGREHFALRLSCLYGSYNSECEREIPVDAIVDLFCPHCHAHMTGASPCVECGAPMAPMVVRGGGIVQICPRRGCRGHILDVGGPPFR